MERIDRPLEVMRARAASYLLVLVNTLLGYGGMAVWMKRRLGLPIRRGAAVMLNEAFHEIGAMALLAGAFGSLTGQPAVGRAGLICFGLWVAGVLLSRVTRRLGAPRTLLSWFEEPALRHYAGWLALKVGQNLAMGAWVALTLPLFGIRPPLGAAVAITQVVHMARALPVAALGLGVDQLTLTTLFSPWEVGEGSLLAFSVVFTSAVLVSRALLGLPFVGVVTAQLRSQPGLHEDSPSAMTGGGEEAAVVRPSFVH